MAKNIAADTTLHVKMNQAVVIIVALATVGSSGFVLFTTIPKIDELSTRIQSIDVATARIDKDIEYLKQNIDQTKAIDELEYKINELRLMVPQALKNED